MNYSNKENEKNKKNIQSSQEKVKNKAGLMIKRIAVALVLVILCGGAALALGAYIGIIEEAPQLSSIAQEGGNYTSIVYSATTGEEITRLDGGESREFANIDQIPLHLQQAFIAIEDERFYEHDGVDYYGFARATYQTLFKDSKQGGSTITQQVIKNRRGIMNNSIVTKLQEQYLAIKFEKELTEQLGSKEAAKQAIIEIYLNAIGLGKGQVGVQAAALRYFNKDVSELTLAESCVIAAITQNPRKYNPVDHPEENVTRRNVALDKMLELNFITEAEHNEAMAEDVYAKISETDVNLKENTSYHSYFIDQLIEDLISDFEEQEDISRQEASNKVYNGGLKIYATIDDNIQNIVDEVFLDESFYPAGEFSIEVTYYVSTKNTLTDKTTHHPEVKSIVRNMDAVDAFVTEERQKYETQTEEIIAENYFAVPQPQAAMTIIDHSTGQVKAIVGGRGVKLTNRGLNRASLAKRQPGSVFKVPASFAPAIDMGMTAASVIDDVPFTKGNYSPRNLYSNPPFRGLSTLRDGVRDSMNVVTVKTMDQIGVPNALDYLNDFGFDLGEGDVGLAVSLGGLEYGVTQLEIAAAYGAIANHGHYIKPHFYTEVQNQAGEVILSNPAEERDVLKATSAYIVTDMLKDVISSGTGTQARFQSVKMPVAGKTGTTTDKKDLIFAGFTPYYSASIYMGHDTPQAMNNASREHINIWRTIMERIHADLEYKDFEVPEGIVTKTVCTMSGKLPGEHCSSDPRAGVVREEIFDSSTVPTETCDVHYAYTVDIESNYRPSPYCPPGNIKTVAGIIRPIPYEGTETIADRMYEIRGIGDATCPLHTSPSDTEEEGEIEYDDDGNPIIPDGAGDGDEPDEVEPETPPAEEGGNNPPQTTTPPLMP